MGCPKFAHTEENKPVLRCVWKSGERQKTHVSWYDYGARMLDPALGRWFCIDPMAEYALSNSPYNYVLNNPIRFIDPFGLETDSTNKVDIVNDEVIPNFDIDEVTVVGETGEEQNNKKKKGTGGINWTTRIALFGANGPARTGDPSVESENIDAWLLNANLRVASLRMSVGNNLQRLWGTVRGYFSIGQKIGTPIEKITTDKEIINKTTGEGPAPEELVPATFRGHGYIQSDDIVPNINTTKDTVKSSYNSYEQKWYRNVAPGDTAGYVRDWQKQ